RSNRKHRPQPKVGASEKRAALEPDTSRPKLAPDTQKPGHVELLAYAIKRLGGQSEQIGLAHCRHAPSQGAGPQAIMTGGDILYNDAAFLETGQIAMGLACRNTCQAADVPQGKLPRGACQSIDDANADLDRLNPLFFLD